jgi:hypothetical protein
MGSRMLTTLLSTGVVLAASSGAAAQGWGTPSPPREGVCLYKDADYRGQYFCVRAGEDLSSIQDGMNDRVSSIRIYGRAEVVVFRDPRFRGRSARFDTSIRNLKDEDWNDTISSLQVDAYRGRSRDHQSYGRQQDPDRIVRRAYEDILEREPDPAGLRLYRSRIIDDGWTEARVRETLRNSPEYRQKHTMTREKAQEIVRQAYLAVLEREPDPGSKGYVDKVLKDKWTQQDVERELRKSAEYRKKIR